MERGSSRKQPREGGHGEDTERSCGLRSESKLAHKDRTGREQSPLSPHSIHAPRCPHWSVHGLNLPGSQRARGPLLQPMEAKPPGLRAERTGWGWRGQWMARLLRSDCVLAAAPPGNSLFPDPHISPFQDASLAIDVKLFPWLIVSTLPST